ncbi:hypothetical protein CEJ46_09655 [Vibrio anguillarum]|nr:hypothetical protein CEJ46_09655 [Vibrio anguillarum]
MILSALLEKKRTLMRTSLWRIFDLVAGLTVNSYDVCLMLSCSIRLPEFHKWNVISFLCFYVHIMLEPLGMTGNKLKLAGKWY